MSEATLIHAQHMPGVKCSTCGQIEPMRGEVPKNLKKEASSQGCEKVDEKGSQNLEIVTLKSGENIKPVLQKGKNDCGKAALTMLGLNDEEVIAILDGQDRELNTHDVYLRVPGAKWLEDPQGVSESGIALQLVKMKTGSNHWVIRAEDKVLCPANGVMPADTYFEQRASSILYQFEVPLKGIAVRTVPLP